MLRCERIRSRAHSCAPPHLTRDALTAPPVRDRSRQFYEQFASAVLGPEDDESPPTEAKQLKPEFLENADRATRAAQRVLDLDGLDPAWAESAVKTVLHNA